MVEPETAPRCVISWLEMHHVGAVLARNHLRIRQQSAGCLPTASGSAAYEKRPNGRSQSEVSSQSASARDGTSDAESHVVDRQGRVTAATDRHPAAPALVEPPAAAKHSIGAVDLGVVEVPAPFPDVSQRVIQTPRVGLLAAHVVDPLA